jgi:hypothetical protein
MGSWVLVATLNWLGALLLLTLLCPLPRSLERRAVTAMGYIFIWPSWPCCGNRFRLSLYQ